MPVNFYKLKKYKISLDKEPTVFENKLHQNSTLQTGESISHEIAKDTAIVPLSHHIQNLIIL